MTGVRCGQRRADAAVKVLKTQGEIALRQLIGNQLVRPFRAFASRPTPLAACLPIGARLTPRGGGPRNSLSPLCVTPYGEFKATTGRGEGA